MPHWFNVIRSIVYVIGVVEVARIGVRSARDGSREITPLWLTASAVCWPFLAIWFVVTEALKWATTPIKPREKRST